MFTYKCNITRVVDGDTIDVTLDLGFEVYIRERIRLAGIDTPEVYGRNASEEGKLASQFVKDWVAERENQEGSYFVYASEKYDARDKYGRSLGTLSWVSAANESETLNQTLLDEGHAVVY